MATTDKVQLPPGRERRLTALMTAMGAKEPPGSQDVIGLMERRDQKMRMDSVATQIFCAECTVEDQAEQVEAQAQAAKARPLLAARRTAQMAMQAVVQRLLMVWHVLRKPFVGVQRKRGPVLLQLSAVEC